MARPTGVAPVALDITAIGGALVGRCIAAPLMMKTGKKGLVQAMRILVACLLLACLFACGQAQLAVATTETTTKPTIGFAEIDLSEMTWDGRTWEELGPGIEPLGDLTQLSGFPITSKDEAASIALKVMAVEQEAGNSAFAGAIWLSKVVYDGSKKIWVVSYWQDRPGSDLCVAIDGDNGALIRIWSFGE